MTTRRAASLLLIALLSASTAACGSEEEPNANSNGIGTTNNANNNAQPDAESDAESDASVDGGVPEEATYYEHVKPILDGRCTSCHVPDGIAPLSLTTYEEAKAASPGIRAHVNARTMPPWLAAEGCTEYQHDFSLTQEQIDTVTAWIDGGTPEGDASNPGDPLPAVGGGLSRTDLTLQMPEAYTPQQSPDDYRCFPIAWPEDAKKYVTGFGVNPDKDEVVHHVIAYLAPPSLADEIAQKDSAEEGPGYTCFGGPGVGTQNPTNNDSTSWLGSWAPGGQGVNFPEGTGIAVEPGSTVVLQVHYNTLTTEPVADQSEVVLKVDDQVDKEAMYLPWTNPQWLSGDNMLIPAGSADTTHSWGFDIASFVGQSILIHDVAFHMHTLGEKGRLWIDRADGSEDCLLDIPRWDFDWQYGYRLQAPKTLSAGDKLSIECQWDNTAENQPVVDGERLQPRDVTWGEGTTDEMCLGIFYVTFE
ncbi:monooxygenase [Persicimonas caeni]|uniref:Monooxygenase n=1 Tax=Persicimonas caeni TaxID=2292766 RepID=A0A4Y6PWI5_PERCE|nr:monooxygenase [Persicimonas caeni]QDG52676.1 monooxygenase [Persicimonas caeni]QED33898.1 monooxygenase [Persicimonas caeni]